MSNELYAESGPVRHGPLPDLAPAIAKWSLASRLAVSDRSADLLGLGDRECTTVVAPGWRRCQLAWPYMSARSTTLVPCTAPSGSYRNA